MSLRVARKHGSFWSKHQLLCSSLVLEKYFSNASPNIPPGDKHATDEVPVFEYPRPSPSSRRVYSWGVAETGALGFFTPSIKRRLPRIPQCCDHPRRITFSHVYEVKDLACGYGFTAFSVRPGSKEAKVFGCGLNTDSQIGYHSPNRTSHLALLLNPAPIEIPFKNPKSRVKGLAAGRAHLLVCTEEGVFSLGNNAYGQCGRPVIENEKYSGSRVINRIPSIDGVDIRSVACGQDHSMFITEKGEVFACGWNADGQTAQGHYESHWAVKQVTGDIKGEDIKKVACTGDCVLALSSKGQVFGWGNAEYGQLGRDLLQLSVSRHLASCESFGKIVDVAAGGSLCMILNEEGQVFVWGYGILGKGPKVDKSFEPTEIPSVLFGRNHFVPDSKVMKIACGLNHQMAINNKGELFAWGHNRGGCLGIGNKDDQFFPLRVAVGATVHEVHCGVDHTVALCSPF